MVDGLAVLDVPGDGARLPQLGESLTRREHLVDQCLQPRVVRVTTGGAAQVGDDGAVGGLGVRRDHRPAGERVAFGPRREAGAHEVAVLHRDRCGVAEECPPAGVPGHQLPVRGEDRRRRIAEAGQDPLQPRRHVVADGPGVRRLQAGEAVEVITLVGAQLQGPSQCGGHLGRGIGRATLLQPDDVVHRESGQIGQILPAKARRTASLRARPTGRFGREALAPGAQGRAEAEFIRGHLLSLRAGARTHDPPDWYCQSYRRGVSGPDRGGRTRWSP